MLPRKKNDKICAIWCYLSVPKYVIINLDINNFRIINQQPKFCAICFLQDQSRSDVSTKINTFTFYEGAGGQFLFLHQVLHSMHVDSPVIILIQIWARGSGGMLPRFFFIKMVQSSTF